MKRFVKEIICFILPLLLISTLIVPFLWVSYNTGEFKDVNDWIKIQDDNTEALVGAGYNEQTALYKLENCNKRKADVIALGTSRVMQFKSDFFGVSFYNCGGAVASNYNEYLNFMKNLDYKPKTVILGLDSWVFNDQWNGTTFDDYEFFQIRETKRNKLSMLISVIKDWLNKKWSFESVNNYDNIGFNGRVKGEGFMSDGSYYYGNIYRNPQKSPDFEFVDTYNRIDSGKSRFEWAEHIDKATLVQLDNLLNYFHKNDIQVIAFLAPFAPSVYDRMVNSGKYGYLNEIYEACNTIFNEYGFEIHNYMDGALLVDDDEYYVDGFHGSEIVYGIMLKKMTEEGSQIEKIVDVQNINSLLRKPYSKLVFADPDKRN